MTISPISSQLPASYLSDYQNNIQARAEFKALNTDLQSGNIAGAQQDFASLLQDSPQLENQLQSTQTTPQATALKSLSTALQSGDLAGAQSAMANLEQTMMAQHRHHHFPGELSQSPASSAPAGSSAAAPAGISLSLHL